MQTCEKELLILSLVEYICESERKPKHVMHKIYDILVAKKLVSKNVISETSKIDRVSFVEKILCEFSEYDSTTSLSLAQFSNKYYNLSQDADEEIMMTYTNKLMLAASKTIVKNNTYSQTLSSKSSTLSAIIKNHKSCYQNFIKLDTLGSGGYGTVYKGYSILDNGMYAIKRIFIDTRVKKISQYLHESTLLAKLNHPNIVRYYSTWLEFKFVNTKRLDYDSSNSNCSDNNSNNSNSNSNSNSDNRNEECSDTNSSSINFYKNYNIQNEDEFSVITNNDDINDDINDVNNADNVNNKAITIQRNYKKILIPVLYIQMELCTTTLKNYMESRNTNPKCYEIMNHDNYTIIIQLVSAIKYIHSLNIVHRDITPQNIFINYTNNYLQLKLGDFGLSKIMDTDKSQQISLRTSKSNESIANSLYAAPEINKTLASDIYSLGIIIFELHNKYDTIMERVCSLQNVRANPKTMISKLKTICCPDTLLLMLNSNPKNRINIETAHDIFNEIRLQQ